MIRNDLLPTTAVIPKETREALRRVGGLNPFREPLYRLILAEQRITKASGDWTIWDDAVSLDDRGGINFKKVFALAQSGATDEEIEAALTPASPKRVDRGIADVALYANEGFLLEKWKPASSFGSPASWPASLGPYPQYGDYEDIAGPTPYLPTISELERAIRLNMQNVENQLTSRRDRYLRLLNISALREAASKKRRLAIVEDFVKDGPASLRNRLSLGAGRVIQDLATKAGLVGHYGN